MEYQKEVKKVTRRIDYSNVRDFSEKQRKNNHQELMTEIMETHSISRKESFELISKVQKQYLENCYLGGYKRILDVVVSLIVVFLILSWISPLLFIIIKLESRGPLFFTQKRSGLGLVPFDCYKFRSMQTKKSKDLLPTKDFNQRITATGGFIRKYSIDELPQFINVLKGEMSIVGPRPHMIMETDNFLNIASDFYQRHSVKPGITGLAQINKCRGKINDFEELNKRIKYDLYYIKNASLKEDLRIILLTASLPLCKDEKAV